MKNIFLAYIKVQSFSGQTASTILIKRILGERADFNFSDIYMYPLKRKNLLLSFVKWFLLTAKSLKSITALILSKNPILYINVGQSLFSFYRILWWFLPLKIMKSNMKVVMSLNGYSFINWTVNSLESKIFKKLLNSSDIVTVVGDLQKNKLLEKKVDPSKIFVVPNSIDVSPNEKYFIKKKFDKIETRQLNLLFLSLLVEKKGFQEYLEAIENFAKSNINLHLNAVLCGPVTRTAFCDRFKSIEETRAWIAKKINLINGLSSNVKISWIEGAKGEQKKAIFDQADIFILPTYYPNEAQPLVLLEAMATGCAIITSKAGEIPSTISSECALIIDEVTSESVYEKIQIYIDNPELIKINSIKAYELYNEKFNLNVYAKNWEMIFEKLASSNV